MDLTELTNRIADLRPRTRATELLYSRADGHDVGLSKAGKPRHETDAESRLTVRVWLDEGRAGAASGAPEAYDELVDEAIAKAEGADPDPHEGPVARQERGLGLGIHDRRRSQLEDADREGVLTQAWQTVKKAQKLVPGAFGYRDTEIVRRFASSRKVAVEEAATTFEIRGAATVQSPDGDFDLRERIVSRRFSSVATLPIGEFIVKRASAVRQPGETLDPGPVRVVLTPRAVAQLFERLGPSFPAERMASDFFLAAAGVQLDPRLHLIDNGLLPGGLSARGFDDRGVTPIALTLLRDGRPDGRYLTITEARRHDVRPTGHFVGDRLVPSNLVLKSGTRSINALLAELRGPSLRVDDLPDLSGLDLTTGAVRLPVHAEVMDANKVVGSMRHIELSGSLLEILGEVVDVCNDTDRWGSVDAPALITQGWTMSLRD